MGLSDATPIITFDKNSITTDVTGQVAVSQRTNLLNFYFSHTDHPLKFFTFTQSSGTVTWSTTSASIVLATGTTSGAVASYRSKKTVPYQVGQSHTIAASLLFGASVANTTVGFGILDTNDGLAWQLDGTGLQLLVRSSTSGSVVNTVTTRANWNIDKLDGTGPSGFNLDHTKVAVFVIEYTWHGAGRVRFGVKADKDVVYCHEFNFDNFSTNTYTRLPMLPVVTFANATGTPPQSKSISVFTISAYVHNHLPVEPLQHFTASRGTSSVNVSGTPTPLIGIRPKTTFNGLSNRVTTSPEKMQVINGNAAILVRVILNPTTVTGASWTSLGTYTSTEFDVSATAITGGTEIHSVYINSASVYEGSVNGAKEVSQSIISAIPLGYTTQGPQTDVLYLVATSLGGNSSSYAAISWEEYQ